MDSEADKTKKNSRQKDRKEFKSPSDVFKKLASLGFGAAFMTEDAVRNLIQDLPMTKDIMKGFLEQAKAQKNELISSIKSEVTNYLSNIDATSEIDKILDKYEIKVDAKLSFHRKKEKKGE